MFSSFNKKSFSGLLAALSLVAVNFSLAAQDGDYDYELAHAYDHYDHHNYDHYNYDHYDHDDCCCYHSCGCNRFYIGAFGGVISPGNNTHLRQTGVAFFTEAQGGPLAIDARGNSNKKTSGFWGLQLGYEWTQSHLLGCITPAIELEAFFFKNTKKGYLINHLGEPRLEAHDFQDTFPTHAHVYLINGVFTLNNCCLGRFAPYLGGGIGLAKLTIRDAISEQVVPPEAGVNHFNADRGGSAWTLAAQAKLGLRYNICNRLHLFGEYRLSYLDTSEFLLGSTAYATHAPTSTWNVDLKGTYYNAFVLGVQFDFGS